MTTYPSWRLLPLLLLSVACTEEAIELDERCFTTAGCPLGTVCDAYRGVCKPEPTRGYAGSFRCEIDSLTNAGYSDVMGSLGNERTLFTRGTGCTFELNFDGTFGLNLLTPAAPDLALQVFVAGDIVDSARAVGHVPIQEATSLFVPQTTAALVDYPQDDLGNLAPRVLAYSTGGLVYLSDPVLSGETLAGYLDVELIPTPTIELDWGADCSADGVAACGWSPEARCLPKDTTQHLCTRECSDTTPCEDGLSCLSGHCLIACSSDADCPPHLTCSGDTAEPGGCW